MKRWIDIKAFESAGKRTQLDKKEGQPDCPGLLSSLGKEPMAEVRVYLVKVGWDEQLPGVFVALKHFLMGTWPPTRPIRQAFRTRYRR